MSAQHALEQYGRALGVEDLHFGDRGSCRLQWQDGTALCIEEFAADILVCLEIPSPHVTADHLLKALQLCDMTMNSRAPAVPSEIGAVQVGLSGRGHECCLVACSRIRQASPSGADLEHAVERILQWRRRWNEACDRHGV